MFIQKIDAGSGVQFTQVRILGKILTALFFALPVSAQTGPEASPTPTPGFNHAIPESILTADTVETSLGTLEFLDGFPTEATTDALYWNLLRSRATEVFLDFIPAASVEALREGMAGQGADDSHRCLLFDRLMTSDSLFLTGNTDTVYAICFLDLERDGPTVIEIPPESGPGTVNDAFFRFVVDTGPPGPDRGKGGRYLILPPGYEGKVPDGYFAVQSPTYVNWVPLRAFLKDGKPDAAAEMWRTGLKIYPLSQKKSPPKMEFIEATGLEFNTIHANDVKFFDEINRVIQKEPVDFINAEMRGRLASLGLQKGKPFKPDDEMKALLNDGVAIGNATVRALSFAPRSDTIFLYGEKSQWFTAFDGGDYRWLIDDGVGGRNQDSRSRFFYIATVNTPAMVLKKVGVGSQYALIARDSTGAYLNGSDRYSLTLPANIPAKNFWSFVVYDPQTRSMLQTSQPYPSKNNERNKDLVKNPDGSVTLLFGPTPPEGDTSNWIETRTGKGWFGVLRLYGPLESWFDHSWQPGEIVKQGDAPTTAQASPGS
ncbi:MAG: DUF1254 domain-containing protein [Myxococcota bacterium]|nr:DUF1254 domain-containing protein [Myxococcota bacterium]